MQIRALVVMIAFSMVGSCWAAEPPRDCPTFKVTEQIVPDPDCSTSHSSDGALWTTLKGNLVAHSKSNVEPIRRATFLRECIDDAGVTVRADKLKVHLDRSGSFEHIVFIEHSDDSICRAGVRHNREYTARVRIRVQAKGCEDLVVDYEDNWPPRTLTLQCTTTP